RRTRPTRPPPKLHGARANRAAAPVRTGLSSLRLATQAGTRAGVDVVGRSPTPFRGLIHLVRGSPIAFRQKSENKNKNACRTSLFPAYLASVRRPVYLAFATTSLLAISNAAAYAQALAPSKLDFTITKATVQGITKEPAHVITKEKSPEPKIKKDIAQATATETVLVIRKKPAQVNAK